MSRPDNIVDALIFLSENEGVVSEKGFYRWFMELPDNEKGEEKGMLVINFLIGLKLIDEDLNLTELGKVTLENPSKNAWLVEKV
ncbi:hypothetical protein [Ekhidna sp.]